MFGFKSNKPSSLRVYNPITHAMPTLPKIFLVFYFRFFSGVFLEFSFVKHKNIKKLKDKNKLNRK